MILSIYSFSSLNVLFGIIVLAIDGLKGFEIQKSLAISTSVNYIFVGFGCPL